MQNRIENLFGNGNGHKPLNTENPRTALEEKQALLGHHVRLAARRLTNGLFVAGPGGLGKSKTIAETLAEESIFPVLVNSHTTPLSLFQTLYFNRKQEIIWLDDCDSIYNNLQILGILRSALWSQGERIVTYSSTQTPDGLPASFVFDSRIIFCANALPKRNEAFKAVLSRVDCFSLDASNEEILEQMNLLANQGYGFLSPTQCKEVVDFIEEVGGSRRLSMRLYEPSLRKVEYAMTSDVDWRDLVRSQLDQLGQDDSALKRTNSKDHDLLCLKQAVKMFPNSVTEQQAWWCKTTKKSRASFFRLKRSQGGHGK